MVDYERGGEKVELTPAEAISRLKQDKLHQWMRSLNPPVELPMMGLLNNYDGTVWRVTETGRDAGKSRRRASTWWAM